MGRNRFRQTRCVDAYGHSSRSDLGYPASSDATVGSYVARKELSGNKRYPLVLMLEPLFRCNLACAGCGKIDYPDKILNERLSLEAALHAMDECGAPVVVVAGGEPLLHKELPQMVEGAIAKKKWITVCTNALLLEKHLPSISRTSTSTGRSISMATRRCMTSRCVRRGVYDKALSALKKARDLGFASPSTALCSTTPSPRMSPAFSTRRRLGASRGITVSPGYAYERAPDQQHFSTAPRPRICSARSSPRARAARRGRFYSRSCSWTSWPATRPTSAPPGQPDADRVRLAEALLPARRGLREDFQGVDDDTNWDHYGTGNYEKCADCMVHSGFEASAVTDFLPQAVEADRPGLARHPHQGPDDARYSARQSASGRVRLQAPRRDAHVRDRQARKPTSSS